METAESVRIVGAGHSPSDLQCADSTGVLLSVENLCTFHGVENDVATFGSGCRVSWAQEQLLPLGKQLNGFGGIVSQRLGGAISTSLHGQHVEPFTEHLVGVSVILANGTKILRDVDDPEFDMWPGSMGMLGVIVEVKLSRYGLFKP